MRTRPTAENRVPFNDPDGITKLFGGNLFGDNKQDTELSPKRFYASQCLLRAIYKRARKASRRRTARNFTPGHICYESRQQANFGRGVEDTELQCL